MNNLEPTQTICTPPARKRPFKRPLTLVAAVFLYIVVLVSVFLAFVPTPAVDSTDHIPALSTDEVDPYMTFSDKIEGVAGAIEKVFYPPYEEVNLNLTTEETALKEQSRKEFFITGTNIMFFAMIASSLFLGTAFILMYISPGLSYSFKATVMLICAASITIGVLVAAYLHLYSTVILILRLGTIPTNTKLADQVARDACTTETVYYILRNVLCAAGLLYFLYSLFTFSFSGITNKPNKKKLVKNAKKLTSGYSSATLVCCYYAIVIALTWTFNFTTKALLSILVALLISGFIMVGLVCDFRKRLKHHIDSQAETQTSAVQ